MSEDASLWENREKDEYTWICLNFHYPHELAWTFVKTLLHIWCECYTLKKNFVDKCLKTEGVQDTVASV